MAELVVGICLHGSAETWWVGVLAGAVARRKLQVPGIFSPRRRLFSCVTTHIALVEARLLKRLLVRRRKWRFPFDLFILLPDEPILLLLPK